MSDIMSTTYSDPEESLEQRAAYWFARMHADSPSQADQRRFKEWHEKSICHAEAYARHEETWQSVRDASIDSDIMEMRRQALALTPAKKVFNWYKIGAMAASLLVVVAATMLLLPLSGPQERQIAGNQQAGAIEQASSVQETQIYRTAVGQRSTVDLPDGSSIQLNTNSLVQVSYSDAERNLVLLRGEALFDVAKNPNRPFIVEADSKRITAVGTSFSVRRGSREVRVTLIEGIVDVTHSDKSKTILKGNEERRMVAGQQLVAVGERPFQISQINPEIATSWKTGRLVFDNEPLEGVIGEVNRYLTQKFVIGDAGVADVRVSGTFRVGSVESFAAALEASFPIEAAADSKSDAMVLRWEH